jgi:hypothetical protein
MSGGGPGLPHKWDNFIWNYKITAVQFLAQSFSFLVSFSVREQFK